MNYKAKITSIATKYGFDKRSVGDIVYVHIFEDGKVLLFDKATRKLSNFDVIFDSVEEVAKYATCISKTDYDVRKAWDRMMNDRYW